STLFPYTTLFRSSETVDHTLRDAVCQIFDLRIPVQIDERQNGNGLYRLVALVEVNGACAERDQRGQGNRGAAPAPFKRACQRYFVRRRDKPGVALQALQIVEQFSRRFVSLLAVFAERLTDNPFQSFGNIGPEMRERRRLLFQN